METKGQIIYFIGGVKMDTFELFNNGNRLTTEMF